MIIIKTAKEIALMREGGKLLAEILSEVAQAVKPGVKVDELDETAEKLISRAGGRPSFRGYCSHLTKQPFPTALCASVNEEVVHAPADSSRVLKEGDIIGLDLGMQYPAEGGCFTDMAVTVGVGKISAQAKQLIATTEEALKKGIAMVKPGNYTYQIAAAIQQYVEERGFSVVRDLTGHGVGREVHEEPMIPNYIGKEFPKVRLQAGMTFAIEPMVAIGKGAIKILESGWTIITADRSPAAHFEHTVLVTNEGCEILTKIAPSVSLDD